MRDELFIDEKGPFPMSPDYLPVFVGFLQENELPCSMHENNDFTVESRHCGYGRLDNEDNAEVAVDLCRQWRSYQNECRANDSQSR